MAKPLAKVVFAVDHDLLVVRDSGMIVQFEDTPRTTQQQIKILTDALFDLGMTTQITRWGTGLGLNAATWNWMLRNVMHNGTYKACYDAIERSDWNWMK